ncbi:MAG: hypothetical protein VXZ27_13355 [SAR324 cluster bacterium]|nr:hypothetical protein [SAR324 cluster bacterium]
MTKVEAFEKAWLPAFKEDDFSLFDEIYHADFKDIAPVTEIEVNLEGFKEVVPTIKDFIIFTPPETLVENDDFLKVHRYNRLKEAEVFSSVTIYLKYKDVKKVSQGYSFEELGSDPSDGQNWNWEDYK